MTVTFLCPAKINTFLAVGPRDAQGYHPVRTQMQTIGLCDEITISDSSEPGIRFEYDWLGMPAENTMTKAVSLLAEGLPIRPALISVKKRIPPESGLGGGSSDAALLLAHLTRSFVLGSPSPGFLRDIAVSVGMDVPFFLGSACARATGYGEILEPLPSPPDAWCVLIRPEWGAATAAAYQALDELSFEFREFPEPPRPFQGVRGSGEVTGESPEDNVELLPPLGEVRQSREGGSESQAEWGTARPVASATSPPTGVNPPGVTNGSPHPQPLPAKQRGEPECYNDFERVAPCQTIEWIERLKAHGCGAAGLSGSGSALFGIAASEDQANGIANLMTIETKLPMRSPHSPLTDGFSGIWVVPTPHHPR